MSGIDALVGKILRIELESDDIISFQEEPKPYELFLGGRGLNQFYLYQHLQPHGSVTGSKNPIMIGAGLLAGTIAPAASRLSIDGRNQFSRGMASANGGEGFAHALKLAGYGNIIVSGKAKGPVYLWVDRGHTSLENADELWGKTTSETVEILRRKHGTDVHIACIGPAGENLVRGACVMVNGSRAAAKCGVGRLMGSKHLKAIVVRGSSPPTVANPDEFSKVARQAWTKILGAYTSRRMSTQGSITAVKAKNAICAIPVNHFSDGHLESLEGLDERSFAQYQFQRFGIPHCPVLCRQTYCVKTGRYAGTLGEGVQANTVQDFGVKLGIRYPPAIIKAHLLCNEYGMDIDTVAESIAWAVECSERGLLRAKDADGLKLEWGNDQVLITLIERVAFRRGFGDTLAEGVLQAAQRVGRGTEELAMTMKGQDLYEEIRVPKGWALGVALATRGGGHCSGSPITEFAGHKSGEEALTPEASEELYGTRNAGDPSTYEGKAKLVYRHEQLHSVLNSLGICFFVSVWEGRDLLRESDLVNLVSTATGWDWDEQDLMRAGERIHNLERLFNFVHAGFDHKDDVPPKRFFDEPIKSGPYKGESLDRERFAAMLRENYALHGWNKDGLPTKETLADLGLLEVLSSIPELDPETQRHDHRREAYQTEDESARPGSISEGRA